MKILYNNSNKHLSNSKDHKSGISDKGLGFSHGISKGFTVLEMLIVSALVFLLVIGVVLVKLRNQPEKSRNAERRNEVNAILNALNFWMLDTSTPTPPGIPAGNNGDAKCIGKNPACYDLSFLIPAYLEKFPEDPKSTDGQSDTGYTIYRDSITKEIVISSPLSEGEVISAKRK